MVPRRRRSHAAGAYGDVVWSASLVAVQGDMFAGTCIVTDDAPHLLLAFALVVPHLRDHRVGSALIAHSAAALRGQGGTEWTLAVTDGNPARALYERLGFRADPALRRPGQSDDARVVPPFKARS